MAETFMGLGAGPYGGMNPATQGLMQLGIGLLSGNRRTQGLARGFQGAAQAYSPQAAMQRQIMQGQLEQLQRQKAQEEAYRDLYLSLPTGGAAATGAAPRMVDPALSSGPMMAPESGAAPGEVQTAMVTPPAAMAPPVTGGRIGNVQLPPGVTSEQFLRALGPQRGMQFLAQAYSPQAAAKPTSVVQNAMALGLKQGTPEFNEYVRAATLGNRGTQVNIRNEGNIPPGFTAVRGPEGNILRLDPIPGSPAAQEIAETAERKAGQQAAEEENVRFLTDQIDTAISQAKGEGAILPTTGLLAPVTSAIGGTTSSNLAATLETIGANISFNRLNQMRQNSKTGAGLGNVTERELDLLRNSAGSLRQTQDDEQLIKNLENHKRLINRVVNKGISDAEVDEELQRIGSMGAGVSVDIQSKPSAQKTNDELRKSLGIQQ